MSESNKPNVPMASLEELPAPQRTSSVTVTKEQMAWEELDKMLRIELDAFTKQILIPFKADTMLDCLFGWMPHCANCGARLSRWGWYEAPNEPIRYYYCLACDIAGREPCIQVKLINELTERKRSG